MVGHPDGQWSVQPNYPNLVETAVSRAASALVGLHCPNGDLTQVCIESVFYYGAVHIHPRHLVVWVLLTGAPVADLPEWWSPEGTRDGSSDSLCDAWMREIAQDIRGQFSDVKWPDPSRVIVMFDSSERVAECGGSSYFR